MTALAFAKPEEHCNWKCEWFRRHIYKIDDQVFSSGYWCRRNGQIGALIVFVKEKDMWRLHQLSRYPDGRYRMGVNWEFHTFEEARTHLEDYVW